MTASSSACAACRVGTCVTRARTAEHKVDAVVSEPAPNSEAGMKLKSRSERREKDCGSAARASRSCLQRLGGTATEEEEEEEEERASLAALRMSSCTTRTRSMLTAASSRPWRCTSAFQGARTLGRYLRIGNDSTR